MKFNYFLVALLLLSLSAVEAEAQQNVSGVSVNGGIGTSIIRDEDGTETFRGNAFAYSFGVEFRFNERFALGLNLFDLGSANDTFFGEDTDIDVNGGGLRGRIIWPVTDKTEFYGILGGNIYSAQLSPGGSFNPFGSGAWEAGIGADIATSNNLSIRFEGRFLNGDRDESAGLFTVGLSYRF